MSDKVAISNQALVMIGASPIVSFDDETIEAITLNTLYDASKRQLLRSYDWNCAAKTVQLATLSTTPINPFWKYTQAWPADAIRIIEIIEMSTPNFHRTEWAVEGRTVLTQVNTVAARYVADIPEAELDAHVEMALAAKLAMDLAYALTASISRESSSMAQFQARIFEAMTTDSQERSHEVFRIDTLNNARY